MEEKGQFDLEDEVRFSDDVRKFAEDPVTIRVFTAVRDTIYHGMANADLKDSELHTALVHNLQALARVEAAMHAFIANGKIARHKLMTILTKQERKRA